MTEADTVTLTRSEYECLIARTGELEDALAARGGRRQPDPSYGDAREPWTPTVWVYDLRTNKRLTLKTRRIPARTSTSSSRATGRAPDSRARRLGRSGRPTAAGGHTPTTRSSAATR